MTQTERRATLSLAAIFAFRMLGLFMILPVLSLYVDHWRGASVALIGVALGIYGLTQALLQIPFGMLSDKFGRKPIIAFGLGLFVLGSVIAAISHSIFGIILGRAIQGAGAVGSTIIALLADLTEEENRTKAMAMIGLTIGVAFTIAMVLGPLLNTFIQINGLFWFTAMMALMGIFLLFWLVPNPKQSHFQRDAQPHPALFKKILRNKELLRLDFGIFTSHCILTANFIVIPLILQHILGISEQHQWVIYLPVLILAFVTMVPMIILAEKYRKMKSMFLFAIVLILLTQLGLSAYHHRIILLMGLLFIFFTAFTFMEASLPSLVSKIAHAGSKGTAMGIYSASQFLGIFIGGVLGGFLYSHFLSTGVFLFSSLLSALWLFFARTMQQPRYLSSQTLAVGPIKPSEAELMAKKLLKIPGVAEAFVAAEEGIAYLKVDKTLLNETDLDQILMRE